jgi:hypothetical protein
MSGRGSLDLAPFGSSHHRFDLAPLAVAACIKVQFTRTPATALGRMPAGPAMHGRNVADHTVEVACKLMVGF